MDSNLKLRVMTALIGAPAIVLLLTVAGVEGVALFSLIVSIGMMLEFANLFFSQQDKFFKTSVLIIFNVFVHCINYWLGIGINPAFLGIAPAFIFFTIFLFLVPKLLNYGGSEALNSEQGIEKISKHVYEMMAACFGFIYAGWFPLLMVSIRQADQGKHWLLITMLIVWSSDSFAYFAGKLFGKNLLSKTVSPKKTWEGVFGGSLGALLVALIYAHYFLPNESIWVICVMSLTISIASVLGDLCESLLKRAANVKDSGSLIPGHGGFLDRFDGVVFALPVMYAFLWLLS